MQALKIGAALALAGVCGLALWRWSGGAPQEPAAAAAALERPRAADPSAPAELRSALSAPRAEPERAAVPAAVAEVPASPVAEPEPAPRLPAVLHARFVDEASLPVAGVHVVALERDGAEPATSGADGRVVLALVPTEHDLGVWSQDVRAERRGFATVLQSITLTEGRETHLGDVVLLPGSVVHGRVTTADGRGVAGAVVQSSSAPEPELADEGRRQLRYGPEELDGPLVLSGPDGGFALVGVAPGTTRLWAKADGMRFTKSAPLVVVLGSDLYGIDLVLEPWRREDHIRGRVVGPEDQTVANARVLYEMKAQGRGLSSSLDAGADGSFELLVPYEGVYRFTGSDPEERWADALVADVACGDEIVIALTQKRWIEIAATDPDGAPIEHFGVTLDDVERTFSDRDSPQQHAGGLTRVAAPALPFQVTVEAAGFALRTQGPFEPAAAPERLEFRLERAPLLTGRVLAGGEPLAGARVELRESQASLDVVCDGFRVLMQRASVARATSAADGRFELALSRSGEYFVHAEADGWVAGFAGPLELQAGHAPPPVEVRLARGGAIEGRVLVASGGEAAGIIVGASCGDGRARTQRTGPGGTFRFEGLTPGGWQVRRCDAEIDPSSSTTTYYGRRAEPIVWDCEVVDGKTTRFELDLSRDG